MKKIKIAYQGYKGTYSEEAILEMSKKIKVGFEPVEAFTFDDLFKYIDKQGVGFVPIENSNAGTVAPCVDLLRKYDFEIIGEYFFEVNHTLLTNFDVKFKDIKKIYSHPQALAQCSTFLSKNKLEAVAYGDTAGSAKYIADNNCQDIAVIGSERLAKIYNLKVIKKGFQNTKDNITRFLIVKKKGERFSFEKKLKEEKNKKFKTTIIYETRDIPGALYKTLGGFVTNGVNLTKIESRPSGQRNFHYFFFLEFEGNMKDKAVKNALEELRFFSDKVQVYGSYKKVG